MTNDPRDKDHDRHPQPSPEDQPLIDLLRDQAEQFPDPLATPGQAQRSAEDVVRRAKQLTEEQLAVHLLADEQIHEVATATRPGRRVVLAVGSVAVVGLIVAVGLRFAFQPPGGRIGESVAVDVDLTAAGHRSLAPVVSVEETERVYQLAPGTSYAVTVTCPRDGVAAIARLTAGSLDTFPKQGQIEVSSGQATSYKSLRFSDQRVTLVVLVTATPATDTLREVLDPADPPPRSATALRERLLERLWSAGQEWAAVDVITIEPISYLER